jgi:hypothetical protein
MCRVEVQEEVAVAADVIPVKPEKETVAELSQELILKGGSN